MSRRLNSDISIELSPRESQLLEFAASGLTDQAISNELGISLATIATYWGRIRIKFGPLSRTEIVALHLQSRSQKEIDLLSNEIQVLKQQISADDTLAGLIQHSTNINPESIVIMDQEGVILYANVTTSEWIGYSNEELVGNRPVDFYFEDRVDMWWKWLELAKIAKDDDNLDAYYRHKDGTLLVLNTMVRWFVFDGKDYFVSTSRKVG
jgi:PAS domain S-box-containing protein